MPELNAVLGDYRLLDDLQPREVPTGVARVYEDVGTERTRRVSITEPWGRIPVVGALLQAASLLSNCQRKEALLLNQVDRVAMAACILNRFLPAPLKRKLVLYDLFIDTPSPWKRVLVRWMVRGASINVLFSEFQVKGYAKKFDLPESRFIYLPYQSSHSKRPPWTESRGDYVFAGGNSARDYGTLCEAVRGTGIKVKVTTTQPALFDGIEIPEEIELLQVVEPEFTRLMASSRFAVMCLTPGRVRGYGEQTILNCWWHGRTIVVADDVSAPDYIEDRVNGYCVPPGDVKALRERLQELWDDPAKCERFGMEGHRTVEEHYTHDHFVHRLQMLTLLLAADT